MNLLERKLGSCKPPTGTSNHGFDTDNGDYIFDYHEHVAYRYEIMKKVGKGSFGVVRNNSPISLRF
jgi:hypothetical protein